MFGKLFTKILLRESMFVNSVLCSIEASYGLTKENIKTLELCDRILLKKIIGGGKPSNASYYLELGILPLFYIILARRLNFLHYILTRPESDLLKKFYEVQEKYPVKNDWSLTIKEDMNM